MPPNAPETPTGSGAAGLTRSALVARDDRALHGPAFSEGDRPVIRWIKCDGLDDPVTRAAVGQATRLFGNRTDYCLCTYGLDAARVRDILAWAVQPVEWMPIKADDNVPLAGALRAAGCPPERFGYWWKWFPERVRPDGPEWILDGDMVITAQPPWFDAWAAGDDPPRVSQDDRSMADGEPIYGAYQHMVEPQLALYSGLVSLPPGARYTEAMLAVLAAQPLGRPHDGIDDMSEQGVVAAAFQQMQPIPIPLNEFPFGRAFEDELDFGLAGDEGTAWGFHFGHAFRRANHHFEGLVADGTVLSVNDPPGGARRRWRRSHRRVLAQAAFDRYRWLGGGIGQWGVPGWGMPDPCVLAVLEEAARFRGARVLDLGTSRGRLAAALHDLGLHVTTVDHVDRGAGRNLAGLPIEVITGDVVQFMNSTQQRFDLIVVDLHGNTPDDWQPRGPALMRCLARRGSMIVSNVNLWEIAEWPDETGARDFIEGLGRRWRVRHLPSGPPGAVIARRR